MAPLYILPPKRVMRKFLTTGKRSGVASPGLRSKSNVAALAAAYDEVRRRDRNTCQECGRQYLEAPALRLWVKDRSKKLYVAHNLETLCVPCCVGREAAQGQ